MLNKKADDEVVVIDMMQIKSDFTMIEKEISLITKRPKNAQELRKMIGTRTVSGKRLVDLYEEGK
ncbi:hypothetical protein LKM01_23840 [Bacillus pacificus]|uniref:hypothetical protein n=1 Tax=Bacillus cereus group TaxID=86661 RepID=UPI000937525E|nr:MULTISPECIES: hypothetical protein [Bacillus cereus group]ASI76666.1 hypothetical protein BA202_05255 [Bacillus cereus]MCC2484835.1 hypothetical protein [Bacillus pacificus]MDA1608762.1 hypothetical protein [Bacillus cereus group sp. TH208-1LC]MED1647980.1 hypothetical protein [Bacillus pacificus]HDR7252479.1 hypothetical protein [Bacillus pacificus]